MSPCTCRGTESNPEMQKRFSGLFDRRLKEGWSHGELIGMWASYQLHKPAVDAVMKQVEDFVRESQIKLDSITDPGLRRSAFRNR